MCVVHFQEECQAFQIKGSAKSKIMFIEGGDVLKSDVESLAVRPQPPLDEEGNWVLQKAASLCKVEIQISKFAKQNCTIVCPVCVGIHILKIGKCLWWNVCKPQGSPWFFYISDIPC